MPENARWFTLQSKAKFPEIGKEVDHAMDAIEKDNPLLRDVLPKVYARGNLDPTSLGRREKGRPVLYPKDLKADYVIANPPF